MASRASSVNVRVYWRTEGKGDEDGADQYHETRTASSTKLFDATGQVGFSIRLPTSPHSYAGLIVKIIWFVQVRVHTNTLTLIEETLSFQLGHVGPVAEVGI